MTTLAATVKIMPTSPDVDVDKLLEKVNEILLRDCKIINTEIKPFAFGLKQLLIEIILKEGDVKPEDIEKEIVDLSNVNSAELLNIRKID